MPRLTCRAFLVLFWAAGLASGADAQNVPRRDGLVALADGTRIHYVEAGRGPSILLVPGWTMHAEIWNPQIAHFANAWRVVAMDPRAQGESSKVTDGLYPAQRARDIKAVIDQLRLSPVVLVGWSMGVAEVAAFVAQFGTTDVSAIVLVDGIAGGASDPKITPAMLSWMGGFQRDRAGQTAAFVVSMYRTPQPDAYIKAIVEASMKTPTSAAMALMVGVLTEDHREALAKIDKPTLIAVAPGGPWDAAYEEMRQRIQGSRLERFDGAGHALFVDQADKFNATLDAFLAPVRPR